MRLPVLACGSVLLMAVGLQIAASLFRDPELTRPRLRDEFPGKTVRWFVTEQPVAETPEMARAVGELLNFDDAVFRIYRKGTQRFDVYAAFWKPGKMSERLVAGHTPDICWTAAGWTCVSQEAPRPDVVASVGFPANGQYRVFKDPQGSVHWVVFWHMAGGEFVHRNVEKGKTPWWMVFTELAERGLKRRGSQSFLRISSNVPWEELARDPDFQSVAGAAAWTLK